MDLRAIAWLLFVFRMSQTDPRSAVDAMGTSTLPIRVDKSHLVTIGERLYAESIELIREPVNNADDADASEVHVIISDG